MFLRPHHLQAAQRNLVQLHQTADNWNLHHSWGLRELVLDPDGLANHRLVIRKLRLRLRDGTLISVPEDGELPELDLKPILEGEPNVLIHVGVPVLHLGRPNIAAGTGEGGRYLIDSLDLEDENTGQNPQPIQVRRLNLRLLTPGQDQTGYEVLPIASLEKSAGADATPRLHLPYIPPILSCDAWTPLLTDILQPIYDRLGRKIELLADQVKTRGIPIDSSAAGDALIVGQLRALNEAYALWNILAFAPGVHPLTAYYELCRLVGRLAIYGDARRPPELPRYDHDNLGFCFYQIKKFLDGFLDRIVEPGFEQRPFEGVGLRMQVGLEPKWMEAAWQMFVGVKSPLPAQECVDMLTKGQLDMKIGSSERVEKIFQLGQAGLRFTYTTTPPRTLPNTPGLIYFQVSRDSEEWNNVRNSLSLAVRLNENRIAGNIQGQRVLTVRKAAGGTSTMEFILFVLQQQR
jgi:type VI secretion system protein ImpJ